MNDSAPRDQEKDSAENSKRREFLKKSAYSAYAAPVMMSLFYSKKATASVGYNDPVNPSIWRPCGLLDPHPNCRNGLPGTTQKEPEES